MVQKSKLEKERKIERIEEEKKKLGTRWVGSKYNVENLNDTEK